MYCYAAVTDSPLRVFAPKPQPMSAAIPVTRQPGRYRMAPFTVRRTPDVAIAWVLPLTRGWDHKEARIRTDARPEV